MIFIKYPTLFTYFHEKKLSETYAEYSTVHACNIDLRMCNNENLIYQNENITLKVYGWFPRDSGPSLK